MFEDHSDTIYAIIKSADSININELDEIMTTEVGNGKSLADALVDRGHFERSELLEIVAEYLGYEYKTTLPDSISAEIASAISSETALTYAIIPYKVNDTSISFFVKNPFNSSVIDVPGSRSLPDSEASSQVVPDRSLAPELLQAPRTNASATIKTSSTHRLTWQNGRKEDCASENGDVNELNSILCRNCALD